MAPPGAVGGAGDGAGVASGPVDVGGTPGDVAGGLPVGDSSSGPAPTPG